MLCSFVYLVVRSCTAVRRPFLKRDGNGWKPTHANNVCMFSRSTGSKVNKHTPKMNNHTSQKGKKDPSSQYPKKTCRSLIDRIPLTACLTVSHQLARPSRVSLAALTVTPKTTRVESPHVGGQVHGDIRCPLRKSLTENCIKHERATSSIRVTPFHFHPTSRRHGRSALAHARFAFSWLAPLAFSSFTISACP